MGAFILYDDIPEKIMRRHKHFGSLGEAPEYKTWLRIFTILLLIMNTLMRTKNEQNNSEIRSLS
ncbi:hypothetical protein SDC9_199751 [bioreactor metagenome]|uniref:Uncharacterized protein n=1 Tax=bioreactor metagenome TaxID=1076179 RepID=A0A645ILF6_9ZZZZ